jgi:hypothetical protein
MQIPVSSLRDTVLELAVFDQHRRKFDNFSSLMLEWKSSNETLAHFEDKSMEMVAKDDGRGQTQLHGIVKIYESFHIVYPLGFHHISPFILNFFFVALEFETQGLMLARQVLYHLIHISSPFLLHLFFRCLRFCSSYLRPLTCDWGHRCAPPYLVCCLR